MNQLSTKQLSTKQLSTMQLRIEHRSARAVAIWLMAGALLALSGCLDWLPKDDPPVAVSPAPFVNGPDIVTSPDGGLDGQGGATTPWLNPGSYPQVDGALALGNDTGKTRMIRVRPLLADVRLDCQAVAASPSAMLSTELFGPAQSWLLPPGRAMPVNAPSMAGGTCRVVLVDGTDLPLYTLFWDADLWPAQKMPSTLNGAAPGRLVRVIVEEGSVELAPHDAVFAGPAAIDPPIAPACILPGDDAALAWSEPAPTGKLTIAALVEAPDGCMALKLKTSQGPATWYLCVPVDSFPFAVGDEVYAQVLLGGHGDGPVKGMQWQAQGDDRLLRFGIGGEPVAFDGGAVSLERVPGCAGEHDACGNLSLPLRLVVSGDAGATTVPSGGQLQVGAGALRVVRARELPAMNKACLAKAPAGTRRVESVWTMGSK